MSFTISGHTISTGSLPFVIAEMSGNHNQSLERALSIVDAAAASGVDAIKLQTYTPDTMTLNVRGGSFDINDDRSLWNGKNRQTFTVRLIHRGIGIVQFSNERRNMV